MWVSVIYIKRMKAWCMWLRLHYCWTKNIKYVLENPISSLLWRYPCIKESQAACLEQNFLMVLKYISFQILAFMNVRNSLFLDRLSMCSTASNAHHDYMFSAFLERYLEHCFDSETPEEALRNESVRLPGRIRRNDAQAGARTVIFFDIAKVEHCWMVAICVVNCKAVIFPSFKMQCIQGLDGWTYRCRIIMDNTNLM